MGKLLKSNLQWKKSCSTLAWLKLETSGNPVNKWDQLVQDLFHPQYLIGNSGRIMAALGERDAEEFLRAGSNEGSVILPL